MLSPGVLSQNANASSRRAREREGGATSCESGTHLTTHRGRMVNPTRSPASRPIASRKTPPPSAPSKTFTIDVPLSGGNNTDVEPSEAFDALRDAHGAFLDGLVPEDDLDGDLNARPSSSISGNTFSASTPSVTSRSAHGLSSIQPQFNLDSATSLLDSFRNGMLPYFPVIDLPTDATVQSLAKDKPFVLLAILAAASGGKSIQGHSLYDEEFRKVLGLKFVSGGERSLELLIGLQIYCAW